MTRAGKGLLLLLRSSGALVVLTTNRGIERHMGARAPPEEIFISDGAVNRLAGLLGRTREVDFVLHIFNSALDLLTGALGRSLLFTPGKVRPVSRAFRPPPRHRLGAQGQRRMCRGQLILIEGFSTSGSVSRQMLPDDCIDPRSHASAWLLG